MAGKPKVWRGWVPKSQLPGKEEHSIKRQISALFGWSIEIKNNLGIKGREKPEEALEVLKKIGLQARRLEWRGGKYGLRHLPKDLEDVKNLKLKITEARAAVIKLRKKITKKDFDGARGTTAILTEETKEADEIAKSEPWLDATKISQNNDVVTQFLKKEGYYKHLSQEERIIVWSQLDRLVKLQEFDLTGVDFSGFDLTNQNFVGADLTDAVFVSSKIDGTDFSGAKLKNTSFEDIKSERYSTNPPNFKEATGNPHFSNISFAFGNFQKVKFNDPFFSEITFYGGAGFVGAELIGAEFSGLISETASMVAGRAVIDFSAANLTGAFFSGCNLTNAKFINANLADVRFSGKVNISNADFKGVKNFTEEQCKTALWYSYSPPINLPFTEPELRFYVEKIRVPKQLQ